MIDILDMIGSCLAIVSLTSIIYWFITSRL